MPFTYVSFITAYDEWDTIRVYSEVCNLLSRTTMLHVCFRYRSNDRSLNAERAASANGPFATSDVCRKCEFWTDTQTLCDVGTLLKGMVDLITTDGLAV